VVQQDRSPDRIFEEAFALHEAGRLLEAEQSYHAVLKIDPDHPGALHYLGVLRAQQGRLDEAITLLGLALAQDPDSAEAHNDAGSVLHARKRHQEAIACFERALSIDPDYAEAHYNRGTVLQALGRHQTAIQSYEAALTIEPDLPAVRYNLGTALHALSRYQEAIAQYEKALAIEPGYARAYVALGDALQALGRHEEAIAHYRRALGIEPELAAAQNRLGNALQALGRHDEAVVHHEKALAINPGDAEAHNNVALALQALNRHREAIAHLEKALTVRPGFAAAHNNLGVTLQALNRHDEAVAQYEKAVVSGPRQASRYANMGLALQEIGRLDEACRAFAKAIELAPRTGRFYRNLADCKRFTAGDPVLAAMEELARDRASLPEEGQRQLLFALGKAFADLDQHERSFAYLLEGNALKRQQTGYDEAQVLGEFERIRAVFGPELMDQRRGFGHPSPVPVFILGMPRSGTTLVEQILASHPKVFGAGELLDFERAVAGLSGQDDTPAPFPELVPLLSAERLRQLGVRYLEGVTPGAPAAARITDKMPLNFLFAGLIHLALPNARIIHTSRDPVDTCFSCFSTLFTGNHRVAYELGELGRYYRAYERLMGHWRSVLPNGVMLEVRYEDVVADLDRQARRIVAHCGLEWEDACLSFYETRRPVRTASVAQVRQPIYRSSVGRWQPYRHLLRPLLEALGVDPAGGADSGQLGLHGLASLESEKS
jgi:tetratricopeptide (TPR) repeat protein